MCSVLFGSQCCAAASSIFCPELALGSFPDSVQVVSNRGIASFRGSRAIMMVHETGCGCGTAP